VRSSRQSKVISSRVFRKSRSSKSGEDMAKG
jgi:hypothetical protein